VRKRRQYQRPVNRMNVSLARSPGVAGVFFCGMLRAMSGIKCMPYVDPLWWECRRAHVCYDMVSKVCAKSRQRLLPAVSR